MIRRDALKWLGCLALPMMAAQTILSASAQAVTEDAKGQQALERALIKAIRSHNAGLVRDLLDKGAKPNAGDLDAKPDRHGTVQPPMKFKPSALLVVFDDAEIRVATGRHRAPRTTLRPDPFEIVKALLEKGADPNTVDYDQTFPLYDAVRYHYSASARLLLQHHADPNQSWVHGITPLHAAVGNRDVATVQALLAAGANPKAQSAFDNPAHPLSEEISILLKTTLKKGDHSR
jgi:ankyrin repeat protein